MNPTRFRFTLLAAALWLAYGGAAAQSAPAATPEQVRRDLYTPASTVVLGAGAVVGDNRRWGQWRGLTEEGPVLLLDLDLVRREDETGTWLKVNGRNLGLDTRELRLTHERQGDWAWTLFGSQLTRREPLIVNTGLQGIGTSEQVVSATAPKRNVDLKVDHDIFALGVRKFVAGGFDVELGFRQDDAEGARLFGRGGGNVMEFLTEPVNRRTREWHAVASWAGRRVQLSAGYSGSIYDNDAPVLFSSGGNTTAFTPQWAMAMPPGNSAHQVHVSGGVNFGEANRASFKVSRQVAKQGEVFDAVFARLADTPESLDAKVVTTLAFADVSLRPARRLTLGATVRFEERDDRTPEVRWLNPIAPMGAATAGFSGFNKPRSLKQLKGGVDAGFDLGGGYRAGAGIERENLERNPSDPLRRVGLREFTGETSGRVELKRSMGETVNGSVALVHSERNGSDVLPDTFEPPTGSNRVQALLWADRIRDKVRVAGDWVPAERWSVQFLGEASRDQYSGRDMGPRRGHARFASADLLYQLSDRWSVSTWASQERTRSRQDTHSNRTGSAALGADTRWAAALTLETRALGIGVKGQPRETLAVGAELASSYDVVDHDLAQTGGTGTLPVTSLPRMHFRTTNLKLYADHALDRQSGVRIDLMWDRRTHDDWTWSNWVYNGAPAIPEAIRNSDGTTVIDPQHDEVGFIGITYRYRWR
ncbi:MAG TPA: MtrB/PioB family decaheme-associated outer membrane protein [Albitalea sp.]